MMTFRTECEPDRPMACACDPAQLTLIACATVVHEMRAMLPAVMHVRELDFRLHLNPPELHRVLQETIDEVGPQSEVVLLGYGLCSNAVVGLQARDCTLVVPRVDDCIALFLGSVAAYRQQTRQEPGTYYLNRSWIEVGDTPFGEHQRMVAQFGEQRATRMTQLLLKNYTRLVYITNGNGDEDHFRDYARREAARFDLRYQEIPGSQDLIVRLLSGRWGDDFVIVPPGGSITYSAFVEPSANGRQ